MYMSSTISNLALPRQIQAGKDSLFSLGEFVIEKGGTRAFIIMDSFLTTPSMKLDKKVQDILLKRQIESVIFSSYSGEPTTEHVKVALDMMHEFSSDCVIAIGGGSAIDLAKAVALFGRNPQLDWINITKSPNLNRYPLLAVPTTAGTGSEATKVMVITNAETNIKMNPGHPVLIPDVAILDPELTVSLPKNFTAYTGLDALSHATEAFVSNRSTTMTDLYALKAIKMIGDSLPLIYEDGTNLKAREEMILASCYAGIAFSNASTNLAHAAGRPLGARFHIPHGLSVALLMPFVVEYGLESAENRYAEVAIALGSDPTLNQKQLAQQTLRIFQNYNELFNIWIDGKKYIDIPSFRTEIPLLVEDALSGNGILTNIQVPMYDDVCKIYELLANKLSSI